jgi:hypothetical protein
VGKAKSGDRDPEHLVLFTAVQIRGRAVPLANDPGKIGGHRGNPELGQQPHKWLYLDNGTRYLPHRHVYRR